MLLQNSNICVEHYTDQSNWSNTSTVQVQKVRGQTYSVPPDFQVGAGPPPPPCSYAPVQYYTANCQYIYIGCIIHFHWNKMGKYNQYKWKGKDIPWILSRQIEFTVKFAIVMFCFNLMTFGCSGWVNWHAEDASVLVTHSWTASSGLQFEFKTM